MTWVTEALAIEGYAIHRGLASIAFDAGVSVTMNGQKKAKCLTYVWVE